MTALPSYRTENCLTILLTKAEADGGLHSPYTLVREVRMH